MRKWMVICVAVVMVFAMTGTAFAAEKNIDKSKAKSIALKNAKLTKAKVRAMEAEYDAEDNVWCFGLDISGEDGSLTTFPLYINPDTDLFEFRYGD